MTNEDDDEFHARGLLDTSVMVDFWSVNSIRFPVEMSVSAITMAELSTGPAAATDPQVAARRLAHLQWVESNFEPIPFGAATARAYGQVCSAVRSSGRQPRSRIADLLIAATALSEGIPVFTRNADDLRGVEGLVEVVAV